MKLEDDMIWQSNYINDPPMKVNTLVIDLSWEFMSPRDQR